MLSSGNGRHRRPRPTPAAVVTVATAAATGAGIVIPLLGASAAQAADNGTWDRVAVCETGGLWSANTGNGFFGGLAITQDTWNQYGGGEYAPRPDLASRAQQITVAERILADLGPDAWHGCEDATGLLTDKGRPEVDPGTPSPRPTLPGLPLPTLPGVPLPSGSDAAGSGGSDDGGTPSATTPPSGTTGTTGTSGTAGGSNTDPGGPILPPTAPPATTPPVSGTPGASGTPSSPAPPFAGTPTDGTGTPTDAAGTPSEGATTPSDPVTGGGRHAKPYSPTDEQLAAADRATRTEVYSVTARDAAGDSGDPTTSAASGTSGTTDSATSGNVNKADKSGTSDVSRYTVDLGDTLSSIASDRHVDGGWHALYDANHRVIGADPNLIKPGQILNLG